jgi:DNA-binding transcriptional regulator YbjK
VPSRPEQILDAAIDILGTRGSRHLTHRAVDAAAALPTGSTSNYFRSRDALIGAIVDRLSARERAGWEAVADAVDPRTPAELTAALAAFVHAATGPHRAVTLARFAAFGEAALRPDLQPRLAATAAQIRTWGARWLRVIGSADPDRDAQLLLDQLDGLMLHQLAFADPAFDPGVPLGTLIRALVTDRDPPAAGPDLSALR